MIRFEALNRANAAWCFGATTTAWTEHTKGIVAVDDNDEYAACALFDSWKPNSVMMHLAIDNPMALRRGFFEEVADYVFNQAGRGVLLAAYSAENEKAINIGLRSGFVEAFRVKDGYKDGVDLVVHQMRREDCKHLRLQ